MKKIKLIFVLIAVVMLVGLTNCKKTDNDNSPVVTPVGTIDGSFIAQDGGIKISKDLAPAEIINRTWSMYAKNSPFYPGQQFALINGSELPSGSEAQQWWAIGTNNPLNLTASQTYTSLMPTEPVRLVMEGFGANDTRAAYLGIVDFDPTQVQFPLAVAGKSLGDKLIINADALTSQSGGNSITVTVSFDVYEVNMTATKSKLQLSSSSITGVSGMLDYNDIQYESQPSSTYSKSDFPVGTGDYVVYSDIASKIKGNITIKITQNGNTITLTPSAATSGQGMKITLSISKVDGVSHSAGVTDQAITINEQNISVDGGNNGGNNGGQNPPTIPNITLNASTSYTLYQGLAEDDNQSEISVSLGIDGIYTQVGSGSNNPNNGQILDMGVGNLITNNTLEGPPDFSSASFSMTLYSGHSYIIRYRKVTDYQSTYTPIDYNYGIFYVNSYASNEADITYQGPFIDQQ